MARHGAGRRGEKVKARGSHRWHVTSKGHKGRTVDVVVQGGRDGEERRGIREVWGRSVGAPPVTCRTSNSAGG